MTRKILFHTAIPTLAAGHIGMALADLVKGRLDLFSFGTGFLFVIALIICAVWLCRATFGD